MAIHDPARLDGPDPSGPPGASADPLFPCRTSLLLTGRQAMVLAALGVAEGVLLFLLR